MYFVVLPKRVSKYQSEIQVNPSRSLILEIQVYPSRKSILPPVQWGKLNHLYNSWLCTVGLG